MTSNSPGLRVVVYHYVRDLLSSEFPRLKGLDIEDFRAQVTHLNREMEMATLETALEFLRGSYTPTRDLCLLTFDDGLDEHGDAVTAFLSELNIQGLFFVPTDCLENDTVLPVHMSHFLMANLDLTTYREACLQSLTDRGFSIDLDSFRERAKAIYRWDEVDVGTLKFLLNYELSADVRDDLLRELFCQYLGDESTFARNLYVNWERARQMQSAGMIIGGHSHRHSPLGTLTEKCQHDDLETSSRLLRKRLNSQAEWPFAYPYGTPSSYSAITQRLVSETGFVCAFTTERAANQAGQELYALRRFDTNDIAIGKN